MTKPLKPANAAGAARYDEVELLGRVGRERPYRKNKTRGGWVLGSGGGGGRSAGPGLKVSTLNTTSVTN